MRNITKLIAIVIALLPMSGYSQTVVHYESTVEKMKKNQVFSYLEIAANVGTTGIGLELATPITKWTKLRAGFDIMPKFAIPMHFGMDSYLDGEVNDNFDHIKEMMYEMSGMEIDKQVDMRSKPTMNTFRLLLDVYPFHDRHWHLTAGFFIGGNSIGTSINKMTEMPSLLALNMYNRLYDQYKDIPTQTKEDFSRYVRDNPINFPIIGEQYVDPDIDSEDFEMYYNYISKFQSYGELGVHVGDRKDGTPYMIMPDKDGTVSAKAFVNRFRPYVGFGYGGALSKDGKWQASFDAGVQFWGGCPKVTTHDGTVLNDLVNLSGKVDNYMNLMKALVVYPTIDFRISYRF